MILVTGATGLLGSHLLVELTRHASTGGGVRDENLMVSDTSGHSGEPGGHSGEPGGHSGEPGRLLDGNEEIVALKRPGSDLEAVRKVFSYFDADAAFERIRWEDCDLEEYWNVKEFIEEAGRIYHCAARVSFNPGDADSMIRTNTEIASHVVNACLSSGGKRLVHVSSSSAIGKAPGEEPATEKMIWTRGTGSSAYSVSKFQSEMEVWRGIEEGLDAVIVNPVIILGAGFWKRGSSSIMHRVAGGMKFAAPGMTGYVGVGDVVKIMHLLMDSGISGERFILSEGDYSYLDIFSMIAAALGQPREMKSVSPGILDFLARLDGIREFFTGRRSITPEQAASAFHRSRFSNEKICQALDYSFTPISGVIEQMAAIYLGESR